MAARVVQTTTQPGPARSICENVVHLQPADALFKACTSSLEDSLQGASHARAVWQARDACFASTPKLDSTNLNLCLLRAAETKADADEAMPVSMSRQVEPEPAVSFYAASRETNLGREQRACALVGFDPAFGAFAKCVSNLQDAVENHEFTGGE
ncbi:MAG TPA: hypothetical protein VGF62_03605 [Rhizomicrobium sp.]